MKNWKTTAAGIFLATVQIATPVIQTGNITLLDIAKALGLASLGLLAKDWNKTGL